MVVRGDQFARLRDGLQRELVLAGHLRDVAESDRQELAVGRGADRLLGDDLHLARRRLEEDAHGDVDVDVAVDADLAGDGQFVLHEHAGIDHEVLDGHVFGLAQAARLAEGEGEQGIAEVFQSGGGRLRRQIARGVGPLGAVAQEHHAQEPLARLAVQHVLQGRADGGLLSLGLVGKLDFAPLGADFVHVGVEGVRLQLEVALELGQRGGGVLQRIAQRLPAGLVAHGVGHRHAPRLVGQHDQRGRLLLRLRVDQGRPEHGQNDQRDHGRAQQRERRPLPASGLLPARPEPHQSRQHERNDGHQQVAVEDGIEGEAEHEESGVRGQGSGSGSGFSRRGHAASMASLYGVGFAWNPMARLDFSGGGCINCRRASKTTLNWPSYLLSSAFDLSGEFGVREQHLPQPHKGPHNLDVHRHGPRASQHAGQHGHALFGEGVRGDTWRPPRDFEVTICDLKRVKLLASLSWNMKSSGNRSMFRFTA